MHRNINKVYKLDVTTISDEIFQISMHIATMFDTSLSAEEAVEQGKFTINEAVDREGNTPWFVQVDSFWPCVLFCVDAHKKESFENMSFLDKIDDLVGEMIEKGLLEVSKEAKALANKQIYDAVYENGNVELYAASSLDSLKEALVEQGLQYIELRLSETTIDTYDGAQGALRIVADAADLKLKTNI